MHARREQLGVVRVLRVEDHELVADLADGAPEIVEVLATTGEGDLLARVVAVDTADLYRVTEQVLAAPGVVRASTSIALVEVVPFRLAPLLHERAGD